MAEPTPGAAARPVAVAGVAIQAVKTAVQPGRAFTEAERRHAKQLLKALHEAAHGQGPGHASGMAARRDQADLRDVYYSASDDTSVAWRQRLAADGRPVREVVGLGENDEAAGRQAGEALGRRPGEAVPGLDAYGHGALPASGVDSRGATLDARQAMTSGLSGQQAGRTQTSAPGPTSHGEKEQTGSRTAPTQGGPGKTR